MLKEMFTDIPKAGFNLMKGCFSDLAKEIWKFLKNNWLKIPCTIVVVLVSFFLTGTILQTANLLALPLFFFCIVMLFGFVKYHSGEWEDSYRKIGCTIICLGVLPITIYNLYYQLPNQSEVYNHIYLEDHGDVVAALEKLGSYAKIEENIIRDIEIENENKNEKDKIALTGNRELEYLAAENPDTLKNLWEKYGEVYSIDTVITSSAAVAYFKSKYDVCIKLDTQFLKLSIASGLCILFLCLLKISKGKFGNFLLIMVTFLILIEPFFGYRIREFMQAILALHYLRAIDLFEVVKDSLLLAVGFIIAYESL